MTLDEPEKTNRLKIVLLVLAISMTALILGCSDKRSVAETSMPVPNGLPEDTQAIVAITADGSFEFRDLQGKPLPNCGICTPELEKKYGETCKNAPDEAGVCGALPPMQVREMTNLNVLHLKGSDCWFSWPQNNRLYWWPQGCTPK